jgi:hypothetical protein
MEPARDSASRCMRVRAVAAILCTASLNVGAQTKPTVNVDSEGVAIHGYDPVAYFTEGKAVNGDSQYSASYRGARIMVSFHAGYTTSSGSVMRFKSKLPMELSASPGKKRKASS